MGRILRPELWFALGATLLLALGQVLRLPSDVRVLSASGGPIAGVHLVYPPLYVAFSPFLQIADRLNLLGAGQLVALLAWVNLLWMLRRAPRSSGAGWDIRRLAIEGARLTGVNLAFLLVLAIVAAAPRPRAALAVADPDLLAVDFHSHTAASHDGCSRQTAERDLRRHAASGFDAVFITDHDTVDASLAAWRAGSAGVPSGLALPLRGEEVSSPRLHLVMLGPPDRARLAVASLPEYWKHGLPAGDLAGIEIANGSPRALEFPREERDRMLDLAARRGLFVAAATDDHGWGSAVYAWNLVRLPGWRRWSPRELEDRLLAALRGGGPGAVTVVARVRGEPGENGLVRVFDPPLQLWEAARSLPPLQAAVSLAWVWVLCLGAMSVRRPGVGGARNRS